MKSERIELDTDSSLDGGGSLAASLETRGPAHDTIRNWIPDYLSDQWLCQPLCQPLCCGF
jgi:hypothetical protein